MQIINTNERKQEIIYKLQFLKGTLVYVLQELLEKYPEAKIIKKNELEIIFSSKEEDINIFRNLYSPTYIEDIKKKNMLNLSRRIWRKGFVPAGINPSLAYILCMIAEIKEQDILLDPFCGSSVIPITALKYFNAKKAICTDIDSKAITASKKNFVNANIDNQKYILFKKDIRDISLNKKNIDKIITNLPFGIRVGKHKDNINIYKELETLARKLLRTKGELVLLTQEKVLLRETFKKGYWNVKSVSRVNEGGLLPEIFIIKRKSTRI